MEEPQGGIEAMGVNKGGDLGVEQGGGKADAGVDGIQGRPGGAAFEGEFGREEGGPGLEVARGGGAFEAAEFIDVSGLGERGHEGVEPCDGGGGFVGGCGRAVGGQALEDAALVVDLGCGNTAGHAQEECGILGAPILAQAGQSVGVGGREEGAQALAVPAEDADGDVGAQEGGQGLGGDLHGFAHNQPVEVAHGHLAQGFLVIVRLIPADDFQAFRFEVNGAVGLVDTGCGHGGMGLWVVVAFTEVAGGTEELEVIQRAGSPFGEGDDVVDMAGAVAQIDMTNGALVIVAFSDDATPCGWDGPGVLGQFVPVQPWGCDMDFGPGANDSGTFFLAHVNTKGIDNRDEDGVHLTDKGTVEGQEEAR